MIRVLDVSIDENLRDLSGYLWQQGVPHRIIEESGRQVIFVGEAGQVEPVRELVQQYLAGRLQFEPLEQRPSPGRDAQAPIEQTWLYRTLRVVVGAPVTTLLTLLSLLVALVTQVGSAERLPALFYPSLPSDTVLNLLAGIDSPLLFLRTLTPVFLHFGILHLVFNLLWLWYFGRQLERIQSRWLTLLLVIATAFAGNTAQYLSSNAANFGGLSGVVYGLVGYAWVLHNFIPGKRLVINESLFVVFLVALVLMEVLAGDFIASAAHIGGLLAGLFIGLCVWLAGRHAAGTTGRKRRGNGS